MPRWWRSLWRKDGWEQHRCSPPLEIAIHLQTCIGDVWACHCDQRWEVVAMNAWAIRETGYMFWRLEWAPLEEGVQTRFPPPSREEVEEAIREMEEAWEHEG